MQVDAGRAEDTCRKKSGLEAAAAGDEAILLR